MIMIPNATIVQTRSWAGYMVWQLIDLTSGEVIDTETGRYYQSTSPQAAPDAYHRLLRRAKIRGLTIALS